MEGKTVSGCIRDDNVLSQLDRDAERFEVVKNPDGSDVCTADKVLTNEYELTIKGDPRRQHKWAVEQCGTAAVPNFDIAARVQALTMNGQPGIPPAGQPAP